ncbi:uncharacterized protein LOC133928450 [Phragmites australis]|uniref:uncharacterized protein LOC133928450 n=1 Tax=Phragmites australis TaxID=29695 RepID=UPI002D79C176|nr:uncharacterized protein LOC133928450 [Phragmites australis]
MARPDDRSIHRNPHLGAVDPYGIHEIRGPLMVGGVEFLIRATGLYRDVNVRRKLSSKQRFEAFLQFREQGFKIFATELVSASKYPVDLVLLSDVDGQRFRNDYWFHYILFRDKSHHFIVNDQSTEIGVDHNSSKVTSGDESNLINDYKKNKESRLRKLHFTRKYFAYRKGLLKLDSSQFNNDPEKTVEWLKSSTGWSELLDEGLRRGLKSHMDFLKEQKMSKMDQRSISESENVALERINAELASELEKRLDTSDWAALMGHYYNRMKVRNLARVCSIQAQATGVILVKQALPAREICKEKIVSTSPEVLKFPLMKQTVNQSLEGCLGSLRRIHEKFGRGVSRRVALLTLIPFGATLATIGGMYSKRYG